MQTYAKLRNDDNQPVRPDCIPLVELAMIAFVTMIAKTQTTKRPTIEPISHQRQYDLMNRRPQGIIVTNLPRVTLVSIMNRVDQSKGDWQTSINPDKDILFIVAPA